jgi:hypothetical protein
MEEADVGMPKAKDPDRDEQYRRVCEMWGPRKSRHQPLVVGKLPSCLLGKPAQVSTKLQQQPANIDTKGLDGSHTPDMMRVSRRCVTHRRRSGRSGVWMSGSAGEMA